METIAPQSPSAEAAPAAARTQRDGATPPFAPLALTLALAAGLAFAAMWQRSLLDDEVGTMIAVAKGYGELVTSFDEWITQPAYFLAAKPLTALLGASELAIRLPALLAALVGLVALAFLGARLVHVRVGLLAALLLALQPYHLFYSQMGRGYTLAAAASTLSLALLLALARGAGVGTGVAYVAVRALGVYAHLGACGSGLAELAIAFAVARPAGPAVFRRTLAWLAAGAVVSAVAYLPLREGMLAFREDWSGQVGDFGLGFVPLVLSAYAGGRGLSILVWVATALAGAVLAWRYSRAAGLAVSLWPLGVVMFYVVNGTVHYPWAFARFFFPALPALALANAIALDALARVASRSIGNRVALPAVVAFFLLMTAFKTPQIAFGARDTDWPAVIERLDAAGVSPREALVLPLRFNSFQHYLARHAGVAFDRAAPARLDETIRAGGTAALAGRRLVFLVDLVRFDEATHGDRFEIQRFGPTTLLIGRPALRHTEVAALAATRAILEEVVFQWDALPRGPIRSDWIYWRIDRRHEHAFVPEPDLAIEWALLGRLARAQGDSAAAREARMQVAARKREIRLPGQVRASWSLLGAHWDLIQ